MKKPCHFALVTDVDLSSENRSGNKNAVETLLSFLAKEANVTLIYIHRKKIDTTISAAVTNVVHINNFWDVLYRKARSFYRKTLGIEEYMFDYVRSRSIAKQVKIYLARENFDFVVLEYAYLSYLLPSLPASKFICDTHDIFWRRTESYEKNGVKVPSHFKSTKDLEVTALEKFEYVLAIQSVEAEILRSELKTPKVLTVPRPSAQNIRRIKSKSRKHLAIGFIGNQADFNIDAAKWLLGELAPSAIDENCKLIIAGTVCNRLEKSEFPFSSMGFVEVISDFYSQIDLLINPVRMGSGLKTKNIEALSFGVPVITTEIGIEGMANIAAPAIQIFRSSDDLKILIEKFKDEEHLKEASDLAILEVSQKFSSDNCFEEIRTQILNYQKQAHS